MKKHDKKEKVKPSKSISAAKKKLKAADKVNAFAERSINTVREPLLALDKEIGVVIAKRSCFN